MVTLFYNLYIFTYFSYVVDFLAQPNNGMNLLVHLLREILHAEEALTGTTTIQANRKAKHDQYRRNLVCIASPFQSPPFAEDLDPRHLCWFIDKVG